MNAKRLFKAGGRISLGIAGFYCLFTWGASAQFVYSANLIGYADIDFVAGSNLVANPFNAGDNRISRLFQGVPDGTVFLPFNRGSVTFEPTNRYSSATGWTDPAATLRSPNGGFLWLPAPTRISFAGDYLWGPVTNRSGGIRWEVLDHFPQTWPPVICASITDPCPQNAPPDGTQFWKWNRALQQYDIFTYTSAFPGIEPYVWYDKIFNIVTPVLEIGEAGLFYIPEMGSPINWVRSGFCPTEVHAGGARVENGALGFHFAVQPTNFFAVLRCTNLSSKRWEVVQTGSSTSAVTSVSLSAGDNNTAFYRIAPLHSELVLYGATRGTNTFSFEFIAPVSGDYSVVRKAALTDVAWQTVSTVAAESNAVVMVKDTTATATKGYYIVRRATP